MRRAILKELRRDLREQGVAEHVLLAGGLIADFLAILVHFRLEQVGRAAGNHLVVANGHLADFLVHRSRELAVLAAQQTLGFVREGLVAAEQHVHHRLRADDLGGRRDQRRIAEVLANLRDFSQHVVILVHRVELLELADHVGEHAARHLILQRVGVHAQHLARHEPAVLLQTGGHAAEVRRALVHQLHVQARVVLGALERRAQGLGRRLAGALGHRAQGGIHDVAARLNRLENGHRAGTGGVVRVQVDRQLGGRLELLDEAVGLIRQQQVGHILDADRIRAHLLDLLGQLEEVFLGVHRADRVADGDFAVAAVFLGGLDGLLEVAQIVQRIEDADDVNAVLDGLFDELIHHVVRIMLVAENVLAAEEHLQLGVGHRLAQRAQALPRIFVQKAHAGVERRAAPALQRIVADLIQLVRDGQHLLQAHTGCGLRLVRVAQNGIGDKHLSHCLFLLIICPGFSGRAAFPHAGGNAASFFNRLNRSNRCSCMSCVASLACAKPFTFRKLRRK